MRSYYKIMLGKKSIYADECLGGNFIGADYAMHFDLTPYLSEDWRDFNHVLIPKFIGIHPGKSKIAAGLACSALWTVSKGMNIGDIVLCPNGHGKFLVAEVTGDYQYLPNAILPHRRSVKWYPVQIVRATVSDELRKSTLSQGTISQLNEYAEEIQRFIGGNNSIPYPEVTAGSVEDATSFALEKHLEDFLVMNWSATELGKEYDIYEEDGEIVGQQYPSDTGPLDILAISKDKKTLLVVELKKGRASDAVVGQIQRYMGYVKLELAEPNQQVKGVIIALDQDKRIQRALDVTNNIEFYRYEVSFKLIPAK